MHGLSSTYACQNCCPNSFSSAFISPGEISGFPGDETLCDAMQQNENCYGTALDPFRVSGAYWWSDNTGVATIDGGGWATAQSVGSAWVRGRWPAFIYTDGGSSGCESGLLHPVVEALCDVLKYPSITSVTQEIIDESQQGNEVVECGRFKVIVKYAIGCPPPDQTVELIGNIQGDADLLSTESRLLTNNGNEECTYEVTFIYRMKNRLNSPTTTGFTSYTARLSWRGKVVTKAGDGVSVRNTIASTAPCP